jgi:guanylate kinase
MDGVLVVLSGPTCSGKDAVMRRILERNKNMQRLVTTNSREKREDEKNGVDYHFVTRKEFEKLIADGGFFEWVEYRGEYRGGQQKHVIEALKSGKNVIWRIDVRGVKNIYKKVKEMVPKSIFVMLRSSMKTLRERSQERKTEDKTWENWSMDRARWELDQVKDFDFVVDNMQDELDKTVVEIEKLIEKTRKIK